MSEKGVEDAGAAVPSEPTGDAGSAAASQPVDGADDATLVERAAQGEVGAFAVLVHRHAADLHDRAGEMDAVRRAFQRAMRRLDDADTTDVAGWLAGLLPRARHRGGDGHADTHAVAASPRDSEDGAATPVAREGAATPRGAPLLPAREVDALWAELAPRWPRGRRPLRLPRWVRQVALVLLLLALAVTIPYLVLTTADGQDPPPEPVAEVESVPLDDDAFDLTFEDAPDDTTEVAP